MTDHLFGCYFVEEAQLFKNAKKTTVPSHCIPFLVVVPSLVVSCASVIEFLLSVPVGDDVRGVFSIEERTNTVVGDILEASLLPVRGLLYISLSFFLPLL